MRTIRLEDLDLQDGMRVLDLGCGRGRHLHALYFAAGMVCIGMDLSHEDLLATRDGFDAYPDFSGDRGQAYGLAVGDALQLPFADHAFDRIICSEVLEHIPDHRAALREIFRVLKPGGKLAISVPRRWPEQICWWLSDDYHNQPGGHVHIFKAHELRRDVENLGMIFRVSQFAHGLHSPYWWLRCLFWETQEQNWMVRQWKKLLEWEILSNPPLLRPISKVADWLMGKSVAFVFDRPA